MEFTATTTSKLARKHVYVTPEQSAGISERSGSGNVSTYLRNQEECYSMTLACAKLVLADVLKGAGASEAERALIISRIYDAVAPSDGDLYEHTSSMRDCPSCLYTEAEKLSEILYGMDHPTGGSREGWVEAISVMCSAMFPMIMMLACDAKAGISVGTANTHQYTTTQEAI